VIVGTYSSVFVASAILLHFGVTRDTGDGDGAKAGKGPAGTQFANIDA
jgi:preprotein translocase subunit SecF